MAVLYANNATTTLASGITAAATSLTVATGTGSLFPAIVSPDFFYATLIDASNNIEIVKVTARSSDAFTITRAQEGTTARVYATGDKVELRITAAGLTNKLDKDTGGTLAGGLVLPAASSSLSPLRIPHGTAPSSPTNGDFWTTTGGLFGRINGTTVGFSFSSSTETLTSKSIDLGANTVTMTLAQLNAAVSDNDVLSLTGVETATNKTFTAPTINNATISGGTISSATVNASNTLSDTGTIAANSPGFRGIPQNSQTTGYTLALSDAGKHISITTGNVTIPANSSVAFPVGTTIVVFNDSNTSQTISITTDTLRLAGTTNTGARTIANYGLATLLKTKSTEWVISGAGVS